MFNFPRLSVAANLLALTAAALLSTAHAEPLLLDRGLPTANLNNAAGANRSNVSWAFSEYTSNDYYMVGDTITNTSAGGAWHISSIRLWTVGQTDSAVLRGGMAGAAIGVISNTTYGNLTTYQGTSGGSVSLYQIDFAVDLMLGAGETYQFFLGGSGSAGSGQGTSVPFVHASNGALSGSAQEGSDDLMLYAQVLNGSVVTSSIDTWTSFAPNTWDKASDVNVQVFGTEVPEPGSLALAGLALFGLVAARRRT